MLGAVYAVQQRYAEAIAVLRTAPADGCTANLIGLCHSLLGQYDEAMRSYDDALRFDAGMADACLNSGLTAFLLGDGREKQRFHQWLALRRRGQPPVRAGRGSPPVKLPDVTLCCVDTAYHELAAEALRASVSACAFGDARFLSDRDCLVAGVRFTGIAPITSSAAYSNFMVHRLHEHVQTDFALVIQYDGFVLNPQAWDPEFLQYDYVGAPMPVGGALVVGNGGFSLRSRKLLQALRDDEQVRAYDAGQGLFEDAAICGRFRRRLETVHGIRFAPPALAGRFASGRGLPSLRNFGFHGLVHLVRLHENAFELPDAPEEGLAVVFRAQTELGPVTAHRQFEVSGPAHVWMPGEAPGG